MLRRVFLFAVALALSATAAGQKTPTNPSVPAETQTKDQGPQAHPGQAAKNSPDAEAELQRAIAESANDRATLVRNLENYLRRFPDAPRKLQVYRAIVESAMELKDTQRALDYAERIIALRPDDAAMMLFAVDLLERAGDDYSLTRAVGYATRVIDRLEKSSAKVRPPYVSEAEWEAQQKKLQTSIYLIRGRLQMKKRNYDAAVADLETSYRLLPNPAAALHLGEIAELRKEQDKAIHNYVAAFVLPEQYGLAVDRREVRRKLGNIWQLVHGNEVGLGEQLLEAYDRLAAEPNPAEPHERNKGAAGPFDFVLRRPDGTSPVKLAEWKGKVLVLNFWATWCLPCRELEPLFEQVGRQFEGQSDVVFLAVNGDEDESRVRPYLEREKIGTIVVFADGLERLLAIKAFATVIVLDRAGKIIYRTKGFAPEGFAEGLAGAINLALAGTS
jgi:thiol-disulfide isomerase/thioredoxin